MNPNRRRPLPRRIPVPILLGILLLGPAVANAQNQDAVSSLLRLVPPDSPLVLTVENLREHYPAFASSPLAGGLLRLPAVQEWMGSNRLKKLISARNKVEAFLGTPIAEVRDGIFGDAVVLALKATPRAAPERRRPEGVLILRASKPELLRRLVRLIDEAQVAGGELARCVERRHGETPYVAREYPETSKRPAEFHADFPDGTFALSNSEPLIREVLERRGRIESNAGEIAELAGRPGFDAVRRRLPESGRAACRLFIDPRMIERLAAATRPADPADARAFDMAGRYAAALDFAGAALTWRDGVLALRTAESIDAARLDPAIVRWAKDPRPVDPELARVPATAFAFASTGIDYEAFNTLIEQLIPEDQRPRLETLEVALGGILLGQDLRRRIFPAIGPSGIAYLDAPEDSAPTPRSLSAVPWVVAVSLNEPAPSNANAGAPAVSVADAIDNALRTSLALASLDHKRNRGRNRIVTREVAGAPVTTLDTPIAFAYAVDRARRRLVLGNSPRAVARHLEAGADPESGARFRKLRAVATGTGTGADADANAAGGARTFLGLDLRALHALADRRRDDLVAILAERRNHPQADPARDLDQVLALIGLFESAFAVSRVEPDASACVRQIGLIARPPAE